MRLRFAVPIATLAALLLLSGRALAVPPPPEQLEPRQGSGWQPDRSFGLKWRNPSATGTPIAAVHFLVRDPQGAVTIGPKRIDWAAERADGLHLNGSSGAYTADVWLEDTGGAQGPAATTVLRFDDTAPGPSAPLEGSGWIGRAELPYAIRLGHPPAAPAAAGIRGYAVSIDRGPESSPCLAADRCTDAETDLRGGVDDDTLIVDELPEGVSFVHAVAVSGAGLRSASVGHARLRVDRTDPRTELVGLADGWVNHTVVLRANAEDSGSGMSTGAGGAPFTAIQVDAEPPSTVPGDSAGAAVFAGGAHTITFYARDAAGNVDDGRMANGHRNPPPSSAVVRIDRQAPLVRFVGSAGPSDPDLIEARVSDALSGPSQSRGSIEVRSRGSGLPFMPLPTIAQGETLRARWNSDDCLPGEYEFRATGFDLAGNSTTDSRRGNGSQMTLPAPLKVSATVIATIAGEDAAVLPRGNGSVLEGRLELASGAPAAGLPVTIGERFAAGSPLGERSTTVRTDASGAFSTPLEPGPSRVVVARFDGTHAYGRAASLPLRLAVRGEVVMSASRRVAVVGGRPVVFRGRVGATPGEIPDDGVAVQLQFRLPGLPWTEFRTARTDGRGRFHYAYRFSDNDSRGVRFGFRAYAPTQSDWPYEPGGSRPVAVRGA